MIHIGRRCSLEPHVTVLRSPDTRISCCAFTMFARSEHSEALSFLFVGPCQGGPSVNLTSLHFIITCRTKSIMVWLTHGGDEIPRLNIISRRRLDITPRGISKVLGKYYHRGLKTINTQRFRLIQYPVLTLQCSSIIPKFWLLLLQSLLRQRCPRSVATL